MTERESRIGSEQRTEGTVESLRQRCKRAAQYEVGSIEGLFPCARACLPPSIPSSNGDRSGARISSDAVLCLCRSACTTTLLPAPTATFFLITMRHRVGLHRPDRGQC